MKYFLDTEFLEGTQKKWFVETKPTIDLISIGIVCSDGREYYAISKDFNLKEAWNRYDWKRKEVNDGIAGAYKVYWIRENVLKPIFIELLHKEFPNAPTFYDKYNTGSIITNDEVILSFKYKEFKRLINKYGKTNKQIAEEIKDFISYKQFYKGTYQYNLYQDSFYDLRIEDLKHRNMLPEFYGYYSDYDWVVLCWLFGKMINLPSGFPMYCIDLKQTLDNKKHECSKDIDLWGKDIKDHPNYPKQTNEHNALSDAKWTYELYKFLNTL